MILKSSGNTKSITWPGKSGFRVDGKSRARRDRSELDGSKIDGDKVDSGEFGDNEIEKKAQKLSKSKNLTKSKKMVGSDFFTSRAILAFTKLKQAFVKAPIFYYFDPERHIRIKTNVSGYAIDKVLSQLTSDNLGQ